MLQRIGPVRHFDEDSVSARPSPTEISLQPNWSIACYRTMRNVDVLIGDKASVRAIDSSPTARSRR